MKNRFIAPLLGSALACVAGSAAAQSSVTLYGVADVYLQVGNASQGTTYHLQSGGLSGSRIGFKGAEDLGGGLKAIFQIESGMAFDTGTVTQGGVMWGRQALVGLTSNSLGQLTLGRQYSPQFITVDTYDPFGTGAGSAASSGIISLPAVRANNSAYYESPSFGGFKVSALGALSEGVTGRLWNIDASYTAGPFSIAGDYFRRENFTASQLDAHVWLIAGSFDFGVAKVMGGYQRVKNPTQVRSVKDDRNEYFGGVKMPVGPGVVSLGAGQSKVKGVSGTKGTQYSGGYDYFLSKRTDLYAVGTLIKNGFGTAYTADAATGAGPITTFGKDVKALQIGIRHRF